MSHLLLDYARKRLGAYDLTELDPSADVPAPHAHSHVATIDNFSNVKLWLSEEDRKDLASIVLLEKDHHGLVSFSRESVEVEDPVFNGSIDAVCTATMFEQKVGTNILSAKSSSRLGDRVLPQLCTLQSVRHVGPRFDLPKIGAGVKFNFA